MATSISASLPFLSLLLFSSWSYCAISSFFFFLQQVA
jgi:hypothetical protein